MTWSLSLSLLHRPQNWRPHAWVSEGFINKKRPKHPFYPLPPFEIRSVINNKCQLHSTLILRLNRKMFWQIGFESLQAHRVLHWGFNQCTSKETFRTNQKYIPIDMDGPSKLLIASKPPGWHWESDQQYTGCPCPKPTNQTGRQQPRHYWSRKWGLTFYWSQVGK